MSTSKHFDTLDFAPSSMLIIQKLCGPNNFHLYEIEKQHQVSIELIGQHLHIHGQKRNVAKAKDALIASHTHLQSHQKIATSDATSHTKTLSKTKHGGLQVGNKEIKFKTKAQELFSHSLEQATIQFGLGPAGTGKTFLAICHGLIHLLAGSIEKIILVRPAVDAGENLGFLPGNLQEKVDPYLRPFYDELHKLIGLEKSQRLIERQKIEIAPIAFMRGRTLHKSFIIIDEAQNTTCEQITMLLTRIGHGSQMVILGDPEQTDLSPRQTSGLSFASNALNNIENVSITHFQSEDSVRHPLIARILNALDSKRKEQVK